MKLLFEEAKLFEAEYYRCGGCGLGWDSDDGSGLFCPECGNTQVDREVDGAVVQESTEDFTEGDRVQIDPRKTGIFCPECGEEQEAPVGIECDRCGENLFPVNESTEDFTEGDRVQIDPAYGGGWATVVDVYQQNLVIQKGKKQAIISKADVIGHKRTGV